MVKDRIFKAKYIVYKGFRDIGLSPSLSKYAADLAIIGLIKKYSVKHKNHAA